MFKGESGVYDGKHAFLITLSNVNQYKLYETNVVFRIGHFNYSYHKPLVTDYIWTAKLWLQHLWKQYFEIIDN